MPTQFTGGNRAPTELVLVTRTSVPVPSCLPPSEKMTVPVGEFPVIVAVNVTNCPRMLGFGDDVSVNVVVALP